MKPIHIITAIILLALVPAVINATGLTSETNTSNWDPKLENTGSQAAVDLAIEWLKNAPTYGFDGIEDSIQINATSTSKTIEGSSSGVSQEVETKYIIYLDFQCSQPGYGDRTDMILAQVITDHQAIICVEQGEVITAIIDEIWDEYNQFTIPLPETLAPSHVAPISPN